MPDLTTAEAARTLRTSQPTVRSLIGRGYLVARKEGHGSRFAWLVDDASVGRYLAQHGPFRGTRRSKDARLDALEAEVGRLKTDLAGVPREGSGDPAEIDNLRVRVVDLEEALVRSRAAAELQAQADTERAEMVRLLLAAVAVGERADALRREAILEFQEGLASFSRPGNAGGLP